MQNISRKATRKVAESISFLYVEHAIIEQENLGICAIRGSEMTSIPIGSLSCLILGPGTSITHRAVQAAAGTDCLVVWSGEHFRSFYATGRRGEVSSQNFLKQALYWADKEKHLDVVKKMYTKRFPDMQVGAMSLGRMRGAEGKRVSNLYKQMSEKYGVPWNGRKYDYNNQDNQDDINRMISIGNNLLYNVCHAIILTVGLSPELGFIHTGHMRSFVWDVADMYKHEVVLPAAFDAIACHEDESFLRSSIREQLWCDHYVKRIVSDLYFLFDIERGQGFTVTVLPELWNGNGSVAGGRNYSSNDR